MGPHGRSVGPAMGLPHGHSDAWIHIGCLDYGSDAWTDMGCLWALWVPLWAHCGPTAAPLGLRTHAWLAPYFPALDLRIPIFPLWACAVLWERREAYFTLVDAAVSRCLVWRCGMAPCAVYACSCCSATQPPITHYPPITGPLHVPAHYLPPSHPMTGPPPAQPCMGPISSEFPPRMGPWGPKDPKNVP